jgi:hypothetical protein
MPVNDREKPSNGKGRPLDIDDALLAALLAGGSIDEAASAAKCSEKTVRRRLQMPHFKERLAAERRTLLDRTLDKLATFSLAAVNRLLGLLDSEDEKVQLGSSRTLLEHAMKLREMHSFEQRIAALEARMAPRPELEDV